MLFQQVQLTTAATPYTTVWVYRCSIYACVAGHAAAATPTQPRHDIRTAQLRMGKRVFRSHRTPVPARYPWYTSVRTILEDPAYSDWFIKFGPPTVNGTSWHSPKCDKNYAPPLCSDYYHNQVRRAGRS